MRKVYYFIDTLGPPVKIGFFTKEDRSNKLTVKIREASQEAVREAIEKETGMKHFEIVFVKKN